MIKRSYKTERNYWTTSSHNKLDDWGFKMNWIEVDGDGQEVKEPWSIYVYEKPF